MLSKFSGMGGDLRRAGAPGRRDGIQVLHAFPENKDGKNDSETETESMGPRVSGVRTNRAS